MYWLNNNIHFKSKNRKAFLCDGIIDLPNLPTTTTEGLIQEDGNNVACEKVTMGSVVYVIATGDRYILNSRDQWVKAQ